jgi:(p)ppGpp synthase/HD superfamily hydrolase
MSTLERAIAIAAAAHEGQRDKADAPYILHPLRVMLRVTAEAARITAVLHDVVEDCEGWSFERLLAEGFSSEIIDALKSVTKREGETYDAFVKRACENPIGRRVKLADLHDNCDLARIANPTASDLERIARYRRAIAYIESLSQGASAQPVS